MDFSEKLTALLSLTDIKSSELADSLKLGRPYVSRLKSGERKTPTNVEVVQDIANYFSNSFGDTFRMNALVSYTSDPRLNGFASEETIGKVIFDWLMGISRAEATPAERFIGNLELFSGDVAFTNNGVGCGRTLDKRGIYAYYGNEGKRQAVRDLLAHVDSLSQPCVIQLFTDESLEWIVEDIAFSRWLNAELSRLANRGVTFERIQPPFNDVEYTFSAIERWLPGYMVGAIQQYYFPWARDTLHRRSLFIIPEHIALFSDSVYGEEMSKITMLTHDREVVDIFASEYESIMKKCRPAMKTYSANTEQLFTEAENVAAIEAVGVYKTGCLSVNTLPEEICNRIKEIGTPFAQRMCESFKARTHARENVLLNNQITDIMCFSDLDDVFNSKLPIPGTYAIPDTTLYYTPTEYKLYLERILWFLKNFPNYNAVFSDDVSSNSVVAYSKGDARALLVKVSEPFIVFDVMEQSMAAALCAYLYKFASEKLMYGSRRDTIEELRAVIRKIDKRMGNNK